MKKSLRTKAVHLIIITAAVIGFVGVAIGSQALRQVVDNSFRSRAKGISSSMAAVLDREDAAALKEAVMEVYNASEDKVISDSWGTPEFDAYIARYSSVEQTQAFQNLRRQLRSIQDVNEVDCLYLVTLDPAEENAIYLVDGAYEDICPPGCIDPLYPENRDLLTDPSIGFPPYITNTKTYGWLVTAGEKVCDADGQIICYAMVDISMDYIRAQQMHYILILGTILALMTVLVCVWAIWTVERTIIRPINQLSSAVAHFNAGNEDNSELDQLNIDTKDEIQSLYESCLRMTHDIRGYIANLISTTQELTRTRIEADEMNVLAHRDALTGVGSKHAYDDQLAKLSEEIRRGSARFGIVMVDMNGLKRLNDTYGHEKGNVAIQRTCSVICDVFAHSPVFRIGGDEFVAVVKDRDYNSIEERIRQFKELSERSTGEPWERVNAAIGYALYDGDDTVDDVFRRADYMMYEHKNG